MDIDFEDFFNEKYNCGLIVHAPDLYKGDHILNLASDNAERSIFELQRVINLTNKLKKYFKEESPKNSSEHWWLYQRS